MTVRFSSRKFIGAAVVFITATLLLINELIGSGEWVTITTLSLGIYTSGNVISKQTDAK